MQILQQRRQLVIVFLEFFIYFPILFNFFHKLHSLNIPSFIISTLNFFEFIQALLNDLIHFKFDCGDILTREDLTKLGMEFLQGIDLFIFLEISDL